MSSSRISKTLVIGLDCATPEFVFGTDCFDLPNIRSMTERGAWGLLESCHPPITVPAWASMMSGKDPGTLGYYGFRNRKDRSYDAMYIADSRAVKEQRVWDILSRVGKKVVLLGVPQTYPVEPLDGCVVAGLLAPNTRAQYTYPPELKTEIEMSCGGYIIDVMDFRTTDRDRLLKDIYALMHNRFDVAEYIIQNKPWDFFMMVEMGVDRIHHAFWQYVDPHHPKHEPGNRYLNSIREFYIAVDERIGRLVQHVGDDTAVIIVSDHGAKPMLGGICVNQWLIDRGQLTVRDDLSQIKRIEECDIDWSKTLAWSSGGYYARMFFNVEDREPQGIIPSAGYESFRDEMIETIESMVDHEGRPMNNKAYKPEDLYQNTNGVPPDLLVYFGDLYWRSVGAVGLESIYSFDNDTGPDQANHDYFGIVVIDDRTARGGQKLDGLQLMDVAPTVLDLMSVAIPEDMQGTSFVG